MAEMILFKSCRDLWRSIYISFLSDQSHFYHRVKVVNFFVAQ
jgi:regulation of enolase protein 1 (concanavalin A-like superfamily)